MIPKNIIQTYKTFDSIPDNSKVFIQRIKDLHPSYNYMFFDDNDIEEFMNNKYPQFLPLYNGFKYTIQRIDLFRLLAIYEYGGFYFDIDVEITKPLDDLLDNNIIFPVEFSKNRVEIIFSYIKPEYYNIIDDQLGQYAFASVQKHSFIDYYIKNIKENIIPIKDTDKEEYVCCTTGPRLLTYIYYNYTNKDDIFLLKSSNNHQMHFGDYGEHHHYGSWK